MLAACAPGDQPDPGAAASEAPAGVVDSVLPMPVMMERFRTGLPEPVALAGGEESRDALVERVVRALQAADTAAFEGVTVGLSEWAWLYYGTSAQARPPYELPPGLAWVQLQENNRSGVLRALERLGGKALDYRGYACDPEPTVEGENRVWIGCLVTLAVDGGEAAPLRLFSAILERGGHFKVLSFANDF
ncbi:MAG: hypothetical protein AMXMBFR53_44800 [Gemmatimonadota bacterium]